MTKKTRAGTDIIGDIRWGTHLCHLYHTKQDLIDTLVPYFKSGLENNQLCVWVTSKPLTVYEATAALKAAVEGLDKHIAKGNIEIIELMDWYTRTGEFNASDVLQSWLQKEGMALSKGLEGLRVCAHAFYSKQRDWPNLIDYESMVDSVIKRRKIIAICSYSLDQHGVPEIIDIVSNHRFILLKREANWELIENTGYKWLHEFKKTGASYTEIGRKLGLSRERARQLITGRNIGKEKVVANNKMLTVSEAARLLHVHVNTLRRWDKNMLPCYRVGIRHDRRYMLRDLLHFRQQVVS